MNLNMLDLQETVSWQGDSWNILVNVVKKIGFIYASLKYGGYEEDGRRGDKGKKGKNNKVSKRLPYQIDREGGDEGDYDSELYYANSADLVGRFRESDIW